jgi:xanthine dehydrogenase small subunit
MIRCFGGQCGFCTPGFVMSIANLYEHKSKPTQQNVKNYLTGNLCRCTGYQPIIQAALSVDESKMQTVGEMYPLKQESKVLKSKTKDSILIETEDKQFFAPATLKEAVKYRAKHPEVRIFSGATDLGVQINKGKDPGARQMSLQLIPELYEISVHKDQIHVGARATLDQLQTFVAGKVPAFERFLNIFASPQIKNSATLVGNLANGSPIADTTPFLLAADASVVLAGPKGKRELPIVDFFKGYKQFNMAKNEFISSIHWSMKGLKGAKIGLYKISQRRDLDISCVNACFILRLKGDVVSDAKIAYGGLGPTPLRLPAVEKSLVGKRLDSDLVRKAESLIAAAVKPQSDVRGTAEFRTLLAQRVFQKYTHEHFQL